MADKKTTKNYGQLSRELDEILVSLESSDLDVDQALAAYEQGMALIGQLENYLKQAENKVVKIKQRFGDTT